MVAKKIFISLVLAISVGLTVACSNNSRQAEACKRHVKFGVPGDDGVLLCRTGFLLSYNRQTKVANWVAYRIDAEQLAGQVRRAGSYVADPDLPLKDQIGPQDYSVDGTKRRFDHGHLAPARLMRFSRQAMAESFQMTNIAPQVGRGFNRGIWRALENRVRRWAAERSEIYVVTGPMFRHWPIERYGQGQIAVPSHYFKVIFDPRRAQAIAFMLPNLPDRSENLPRYLVSIRQVERLSGLNFHEFLPDADEDRLEGTIRPADWLAATAAAS